MVGHLRLCTALGGEIYGSVQQALDQVVHHIGKGTHPESNKVLPLSCAAAEAAFASRLLDALSPQPTTQAQMRRLGLMREQLESLEAEAEKRSNQKSGALMAADKSTWLFFRDEPCPPGTEC